MTKRYLGVLGLVILLAVGCLIVGAAEYVPGTPLKVGFVYVGPIGDLGWTNAHDEARLIAEATFPWLETVYVESVAEGQEGPVIDDMIQQLGCDVILTTSFGFMDGTLAAALRYPDKIFAHCSGFKNARILDTRSGELAKIDTNAAAAKGTSVRT